MRRTNASLKKQRLTADAGLSREEQRTAKRLFAIPTPRASYTDP